MSSTKTIKILSKITPIKFAASVVLKKYISNLERFIELKYLSFFSQAGSSFQVASTMLAGASTKADDEI